MQGQNVVLLGQYDLWVKRGVVSLMGAKLHPSPRSYRVYAPSTHSLPVIKCVAGVDGEAEIEVKSCHNGIQRLRYLSPLYQRIWNGKNTSADRLTLKKAPASTKRTFSVVSSSSWAYLYSVSLLLVAVHVLGRLIKPPFAAIASRKTMELGDQDPFSAKWTIKSAGLRT